jgi:acyl-CoA dehydrogenase
MPDDLSEEQRLIHMDATVDISRFKIVKSMFPETAGKYAGPEA